MGTHGNRVFTDLIQAQEELAALRARLEQAEDREQALREALEEYASARHWWQAETGSSIGLMQKVWAWGDMRLPWQIAQRALADAQPATTTGVPDPVVTNPKQEPAFQ